MPKTDEQLRLTLEQYKEWSAGAPCLNVRGMREAYQEILDLRSVVAELEQHVTDVAHKTTFADANTYQELAGRTDNDERPPEYYLLCLCEEAGEVAGVYKKHWGHGHELDLDKVKKELGDVAWYLARAADKFGLPLSEIFEANIEKLKKRYPEGFSSEASINRSNDD